MEDQSQTPNSSQKGGQKEQDRKTAVRMIVDVINGLEIKIDEYKIQNSTDSQKQIRWTKITVGILLIYTLATLWLVCETRRMVNEAIIAERPWVAPFESSSGGFSPRVRINQRHVENNKLVIFSAIDIFLHNGGKSPAYIETAQVGFHSYEIFPKAPEITCETNSGPHLKTILPGTQTEFSCLQHGTLEATANLYALGNVTYRDIRTGKTYFAHFCERYNPSTKGFDLCQQYNDAN